MADLEDVRRIAGSLPEVTLPDPESDDQFGCGVMGKGFAWTWMQRAEQKGARVPRPDVLAVRTRGVVGRDELIAAAPDAWLVQAPKLLAKEHGLTD